MFLTDLFFQLVKRLNYIIPLILTHYLNNCFIYQPEKIHYLFYLQHGKYLNVTTYNGETYTREYSSSTYFSAAYSCEDNLNEELNTFLFRGK